LIGNCTSLVEGIGHRQPSRPPMMTTDNQL
jgi:hypothetical protein